MDRLSRRQAVILIAATNRPQELHEELLAPGRIDREVHISLPTEEQRVAIFGVHSRTRTLAPSLDFSQVYSPSTSPPPPGSFRLHCVHAQGGQGGPPSAQGGPSPGGLAHRLSLFGVLPVSGVLLVFSTVGLPWPLSEGSFPSLASRWVWALNRWRSGLWGSPALTCATWSMRPPS